MPYPQGHRDEIRTKIVRAAQRLFNVRGFEAVSIDQIMAAAKLTRGGFYRYFESKSDLYAEAMDCFFTNPACGNRWEGVEVDPAKGAIGPQIVRAYLSRQHFQDIEDSCPMVALPGDVARSGTNAKRAYENALKAMIEHLQNDFRAKDGPDRNRSGDCGAMHRRHGDRAGERRSGHRRRGERRRDDHRASARRLVLNANPWGWADIRNLDFAAGAARQAAAMKGNEWRPEKPVPLRGLS